MEDRTIFNVKGVPCSDKPTGNCSSRQLNEALERLLAQQAADFSKQVSDKATVHSVSNTKWQKNKVKPLAG